VPTIVLNGESRAIQDGQTVAELLRELHLDPRQVAVERNREIVPRAEHGQVVLADADQLEIVTFVGGG
jgi:sulfur carrier protein